MNSDELSKYFEVIHIIYQEVDSFDKFTNLIS